MLDRTSDQLQNQEVLNFVPKLVRFSVLEEITNYSFHIASQCVVRDTFQ